MSISVRSFHRWTSMWIGKKKAFALFINDGGIPAKTNYEKRIGSHFKGGMKKRKRRRYKDSRLFLLSFRNPFTALKTGMCCVCIQNFRFADAFTQVSREMTTRREERYKLRCQVNPHQGAESRLQPSHLRWKEVPCIGKNGGVQPQCNIFDEVALWRRDWL
jgi:hypothetical protein